jgi:aspartate-semialdehyde dehydrogenase
MKIAIVGATGMVGQSFIQVLEEYQLPIDDITFLASKRSSGKTLQFNQKTYVIEELSEHSFDSGYDYALFSAGGSVSGHYAPIAAKHGCIVVDNSSFWRMHDEVPLIVPEINFESMNMPINIIANPNCSTIQSVLPLNALKSLGLKRIVYTTYQAVSGSGYKGVLDLERNLNNEESTFYPKQILHNVIPQIDVFLENGNTKEEEKMIKETQKILNLPELKVSATCVRVPVFNGHSVAINVEFEKDFTLDEVYTLLNAQKGLVVWKDDYPTALDVSGQDDVYVGRIRRDESVPFGLNLWVVGDNIRKGAASNAVQIVKKLMEAKHVI